MSDEEYFEQLCSNSIDGTLTDSEREKLEAHLAECPSCAALKKDLEEMQALFAGEVEPPAGLHEGIMQRLEQESKLKVVQPEKPVRRMPVFTMVAAAAVVVLVVLGGGLMPMFSTVNSSGGATADSAASADAAAAEPGSMDAAIQESADEAGLAGDSSHVAENGSVDSAAGQTAQPEATGGAATAPYSTGSEENMESLEPSTKAAGGGAAAGAADASESDSATQSAGGPQIMTVEGAQKMVNVPESLRAMTVAHCYLAQDGGELPDIEGQLLATDGQASWFLLDNNLTTIQETLGALEDAGYTVSSYEDAGLTIDSKATSWVLVVANE